MNESAKGWVLVIGILLIISAGVIGVVLVFQNATHRVLTPLEQGNQRIQTQVAQFLHPTPTVIPDPVTIIHEVRSLARLETIQYSVEKVITAESAQGRLAFLFGDRLIFVAHGTVIAGVDLEKIRPTDITLQNGVVMMRLPAPEIFVATLDNEKSYVYNRQTGVLTHGDANLETTARRVAEEEIRQSAIDDGILNIAQQNAENFLSRLIRDLGYQDVVFEVATPIPVTPTP